MTHIDTMRNAIEAAYLAGFNASGEGYNGEYPFQDHGKDPEQDAAWVKDRENYVNKAIQAGRALLEELKWQDPVAGVVVREGLPTLLRDSDIKPTDKRLYTHQQPAQPKAEPDLSGLKPSTQEVIKRWIADGTFIERAIGAMQEQERENMRLEKTVAAQPNEPLTDELLSALDRIVKTVPAQDGNGGFIVDHHDMDGEYLGTQQIDPMWVVQEMAAIAHNALEAHGIKGEA